MTKMKQGRLTADNDSLERCRRPHENGEAAEKAFQAFNAELYDLRVKHGISDVLVTVQDSYLDDDGERVSIAISSMYGNSLMEEPLAAYAFGCAQSRRQQHIGRLLEDSSKNAVKPAVRGE